MRTRVFGSPLMLALVFGCGSSGATDTNTNPVVAPPAMPGMPGAAGSSAPAVAPRAGSGAMMGTGLPGTTAMPDGAMPGGTNTMPNPGMAGATGMAGSAAAGSGAPATAGTGAMPPPAGVSEPTIPAVKGECPDFRSGTITFSGLGGIEIVAGTKPAAPTAPMVFYWHGTGSFSGEYALMATAVQQGVVSEGGILVSFQGTTGGDLLSGTAIFGMGDLDLTDQLLACAVKDHNIDPHRVFATGCSAGGLMSASMATLRSSYMAAAAPNSGGWTAPLKFQNAHTPALMTVHGAPGSDVVIIDFSESSKTADMAFKTAGGFVINCNHGGGHCGGGGLAPDIWTFFKAHPFGVTPEPWTGGLPSGFSTQCKIF